MLQRTTNTPLVRRPRFRRASEPPAFRLTDDDVEIVRQLARHRFLRSTHVAALVGRSLDRTNDRLSRLFHVGYLDRPRAQLDYYPSAGSAPIVYALADRGARLLIERDGVAFANVEWSRKNREAGRPFIEHQLEIMDFYVERKMRGYLTAYAAKQHEKKFGWKAFRVLTVTTDDMRKRTMLDVLAKIRVPHSPGPALFWFLPRRELAAFDPLAQPWQDGTGRNVSPL